MMENIPKNDKSHGHELEWKRLEAENMEKSTKTDDIYHYRAKACASLLKQYR